MQTFWFFIVATFLLIGSPCRGDYLDAKNAFEAGDYNLAFKMATKSEAKGEALGTNLLGQLYERGLGVEKDLVRACGFYQKAVGLNEPGAFFNLGKLLIDHKEAVCDLIEAENALKGALKKEIFDAAVPLTLAYYYKVIPGKDQKNALELALSIAEKGHVPSMRLSGVLLGDGAESFKWFLKAAERGDPASIIEVGERYLKGNGTKQNIELAISYLKSAAVLNEVLAFELLGIIYGNDILAENNYSSAIEYNTKAADSGSARALIHLAQNYRATAQYEKAETNIKKAIEIIERDFPERWDALGGAYVELANISVENGNYSLAEDSYLKSLELNKKSSGEEDHNPITLFINIAAFYSRISVFEKADPYYQKALKLVNIDEDFESYYALMNNFAANTGGQGKTKGAIEILENLETEIIKRFGAKSSRLAPVNFNLGNNFFVLGLFQRAKSSYEKALEINSSFLNPYHDDISRNLQKIGDVFIEMGQPVEAFQYYDDSLEIKLETLGNTHLEYITLLYQMSEISREQQLEAQQKKYLQTLITSYKVANRSGRFTFKAISDKVSFERVLLNFLDLLTNEQNSVIYVNTFFDALQILSDGYYNENFAEVFMRLNPEFGSSLSSINELKDKKSYLLKKLGSGPDIDIKVLRDITGVNSDILNMTKMLMSEFPHYSELVNPQPLSLVDTQAALGSDEALFTFISDDETENTYAFLVRKEDARAYKVDLSKSKISDIVSVLREGIDLSNSVSVKSLPKFDMELSYELYTNLFGPVEDLLEGIEHLLVVPNGPLESLPLNLLVTKEPMHNSSASIFDNYQSAAWLPKKYSLTRLPSVSSLKALRVFASSGRAQEPFMGFGDPVLNGEAEELRGLNLVDVYQGLKADLEKVRSLPELPETSDELKRIAEYLNATAESLFLRERATETFVKNTDLKNSRVIAFATHGLIGGELTGLAEPALVMTPPLKGTEEDDGLLKASEVAQLNLNADIIILSACNTASGENLGAEGLSGLARAFIYAGARSLLVSHWSIDSGSAAELTTGLFEALETNPEMGRAAALQSSMMSLASDSENLHYSHPAFWGPFSLIGEVALN
ncbi:CHAT domain-containing protein [Paracoccaceae bacterium]|nr:CHAT domain-containing protein [Paracoccaceae bacterium]